MKAATFRLCLCALLILGITAKPYLPLGKLANEDIQETISKYDAKKMHARVEVRPKDINLGANVWKSMEEYEPPLKAEEGRKEVDLDPVFSEEEPELDWDEVYHRDVEQLPFQSAPKASASIDVPSQWKYSEPEEDLDDLYHP